MSALRLFLVFTLVISSLALVTAADASCIQESLADRAARAEAVGYGRVVRTEGAPVGGAPARVAVFQAERILKGSVPARITVALGPGTGGGVAVAATSVDYVAQTGTDHTLFLRSRGPDLFETDACAGSHGGPPSADETGFFGPGTTPERVPGGGDGANASDLIIAAVATLIALAAGVGAIVYARSSARGKVVI